MLFIVEVSFWFFWFFWFSSGLPVAGNRRRCNTERQKRIGGERGLPHRQRLVVQCRWRYAERITRAIGTELAAIIPKLVIDGIRGELAAVAAELVQHRVGIELVQVVVAQIVTIIAVDASV